MERRQDNPRVDGPNPKILHGLGTKSKRPKARTLQVTARLLPVCLTGDDNLLVKPVINAGQVRRWWKAIMMDSLTLNFHSVSQGKSSMESMVFSPMVFPIKCPWVSCFFSPETHALYHLGLPGSCCLPFKSLSGSVGTVPRFVGNGMRSRNRVIFNSVKTTYTFNTANCRLVPMYCLLYRVILLILFIN